MARSRPEPMLEHQLRKHGQHRELKCKQCSERLEGVEPGSMSPHSHLRVGSQRSSISLNTDYTHLEPSLVVGRGEPVFLLCNLLLLHGVCILLEGTVMAFFCHMLPILLQVTTVFTFTSMNCITSLRICSTSLEMTSDLRKLDKQFPLYTKYTLC